MEIRWTKTTILEHPWSSPPIDDAQLILR